MINKDGVLFTGVLVFFGILFVSQVIILGYLLKEPKNFFKKKVSS